MVDREGGRTVRIYFTVHTLQGISNYTTGFTIDTDKPQPFAIGDKFIEILDIEVLDDALEVEKEG